MLAEPMVLCFALLAAFCIGLSKAGFSGLSLVSVVILADIYGSKSSVGLALPLLIAADFLAYPAFRKHGSWKPVWRILIPAVGGLCIGWIFLGMISENVARRTIGGCVLGMALIQLISQLRSPVFERLTTSSQYGISAGVLGGFSSMVANAAGPVIQLYLLTQRIPKMDLIGIGARFFLILNVLKVPFNTRLALITSDSLMDNLKLFPAVALGIFGGKWLLHRVPQRAFEWIILLFSVAAGIRMIVF